MILQTIAAFNLVCSVTVGAEPARSTLILRIDLESRRYCMDQCFQTQPLTSVTESEIVLHDGPAGRSNVVVRSRVDLVSGSYSLQASGSFGGVNLEAINTSGTCQRAPFTGFPRPAAPSAGL